MSNPDGGDRLPQWSLQETREFLAIRSELDRTFMETKRNKLLWNIISAKMKEKGYNRSPDQCKCKWKNLVTRYKGKCKWKNLVTRYKGSEAIEQENNRQFPFYNELRAIFSARMKGASRYAKKKRTASSSEGEEESNDEIDSAKVGKNKKLKSIAADKRGSNNSTIEALQEFMRQQVQLELQWREEMEAREDERMLKQLEWQQAMEELEREKMMFDCRWREKMEQRWMREEARAEKKDALLTTLLNKLIHEDI